jgi:hypothetical protein
MQESQNHQKRTKNNKVIKMTQLAQQLIGQFRGTRKRKAPATVGNCGLAQFDARQETVD